MNAHPCIELAPVVESPDCVVATLVVQRQHIQLVGDGEHDMEVIYGEKPAFAGCEPAFARLRLALRAAPVAASNGVNSITWLMESIF
jgi:hypothetical protein